ncbi:hypothetical protein BH23ACI1_BH23ACI1_19850 [soil metagenome]
MSLLACGGGRTPTGPGADLHAFTGTHTRVVWVQGDGTDPYAFGTNLTLMGFDSHDGRGERPILSDRRSYVKPMLTPRGDRIVFSTSPMGGGQPEVFLLGWDGSGLAPLVDGFALAVWENPADSSEWVYVGQDNEEGSLRRVVRLPIDNPAAAELVWDKTQVSYDTFQVSADGRFAAGLFPWPEAAIAELPNGALRKVGEGCWTAMSTVRGPVMWYFDGAHRNLTLVDAHTDKRWTVAINTAPGFDNPEVYHPRWTNHPRFFAISGPYDQGGANQVRSGGTQAEVWLARFSEDFSHVEAWFRVTENEGGDSYPDVWIDRTRNPHAARPTGPVGPADAPTEGTRAAASTRDAGRVVLHARLVHAGPIPTPQSILPYRHALVVNEYEVVSVEEGTRPAGRLRVAQWAIRDSQVLPDARTRTGEALRLVVEFYDAHPELEGERLITDLSASDQPLYYHVPQ